MDKIFNIIKTVLPVAIGLGMLWCIHRKGSFVRKSNKTGTRNTKLQGQEKANPDNLQDKSNSTNGNRRLPNVTVNESNRQTAHQNGNTKLLYDINDNEKHDALLLYAKEDKPLVKHLQQVLVSNLGTDIDDLNIVLYEEFAREVQSYFKTTSEVFRRCRYLFVVVTSNFTKDSLMRYQHEIALMDSIRNPSCKDRVIPVWAEEGSQSLLNELSVLRGIDYERDQFPNFQKFKTTFQYGRRKIHL